MIHPALRRKKPIPRTSKPRRVRKGSRAAEKLACDRLFSQYIRKRDKHCQVCGTEKGLQCAHLFSRRYINTRWDETNAVALCQADHYRLTFDPLAWEDFCRKRLGSGYDWLRAAAQMTGTRPDYQAILLWLRAQLGQAR